MNNKNEGGYNLIFHEPIKLENLSEKDFNKLKEIGYLWEFYPEAPEFYKDIKRNEKTI